MFDKALNYRDTKFKRHCNNNRNSREMTQRRVKQFLKR